MAYIEKIKLPSGAEYDIRDKEAHARIDAILDGVTEEELNTLKELSDALQDDEDFGATVIDELSKKSNKTKVTIWTRADI